jgi:hypothetical protein
MKLGRLAASTTASAVKAAPPPRQPAHFSPMASAESRNRTGSGQKLPTFMLM